jgi:hypothetical protein
MIRFLLGVAAGWLCASLAFFSPHAHADGLDPHMPNGGSLWCQGGLGNVALIPYCNGQPYADGSFWHQEAASPFGIGGPAGLPWKPPVLVKP